jgi:hypothetical protein
MGERVYALLLWFYPPDFRAVYGSEMRRTFREWRAGWAGGGLRFWLGVLLDVWWSAPRAWWSELRARREARRKEPGAVRPPYTEAGIAAGMVFSLYVVTLAPTIAFWDSGEYITVAHILGIPHPPGSPLFVVLGKAWDLLLSPLGFPVAVRLNLFSAALSAGAHFFWFLVVHRMLAGWVTDERARLLGAAAAVAISATAFTVWYQSVVNEKVYMIPLLTTALVSWLVLRWRDSGRPPRTLAIVAFVLALTATNHLMGVLAVPAVMAFVLLVDHRALLNARLWRAALPLVALGLALHCFLPIRAAQAPLISEGEPVCESAVGAALSVYTWGAAGCPALSAVLTREQYAKPSILADPSDPRLPRSPQLVASQFLNYAQYFNWQWARGLGGLDPLVGGARPAVTLLFLLLGLAGIRRQWRGDRESAAYLGVLFLTLSAGLVIYLNFRYGFSIARDRFPAAEMHEVRERDYFFLIGFSVWGLWAGIGLAGLWDRLASAVGGVGWRGWAAAAPVLAVMALPLALNWSWASRADDHTARDWAYNVLMSVEPYGVLFTNGDNDTFPLWYLQEVEGLRKDVTVVVLSYLNTSWYPRQLRDLTTPCDPGVDPVAQRTRIVCQRPFVPADLPRALVQAGWSRSIEPPRDSILPLTDEEIDRIASEFVITQQPLSLRAGEMETSIASGTRLVPADLFVAAVLRSAIGDRPIHFMPGAPPTFSLGLYAHTVRRGLVWKVVERNGARDGIVELPGDLFPTMAGAAIDLPLTDTLVQDVYLRRGRIMDPGAPWVDEATTNILLQYVLTHYTAAEAHALLGDEGAATRHVARARWWNAVAENRPRPLEAGRAGSDSRSLLPAPTPDAG